MTKYTHKHNSDLTSLVREVVFGMEDGMVSTLGSITGIAVGSGDRFTVLLAGIVIICVEAISMGIGSYLSNSTSKEIEESQVKEKKEDLEEDSEEENIKNLRRVYKNDGWPEEIAKIMARHVVNNRRMLLREHKTHELGIIEGKSANPVKNGIFMYFSYNIGGLIPLCSYFVFPVNVAIFTSIIFTLLSLFLLGSITTKFTKSSWIRSGLRMFLLGGTALLVGIVIGGVVSKFSLVLGN